MNAWKRGTLAALGLLTLSGLALSCGGRPTASLDPAYVRAAQHANLPLLGVEVSAIGLGFLVGEDPGAPGLGSVAYVQGVFNALFRACATVEARAETGEA